MYLVQSGASSNTHRSLFALTNRDVFNYHPHWNTTVMMAPYRSSCDQFLFVEPRFFFSVILGDAFRPAERTAKQMCFESYVSGSVPQKTGSFAGTSRPHAPNFGTV